MTSAEMFRLARRRAGLSQRELAQRAGVSTSTVARVESGAVEASPPVLRAVLEAADLEVSVDIALPPADPPLLRHLRRSLPQRLDLLLGGIGHVHGHRPPRWDQLERLSTSGLLLLTGASAVGMWVPAPAPANLTLRRAPRSFVMTARPIDLEGLDVEDVEELPPGLVRIGAIFDRLFTHSPGELALDPACAASRSMLRRAARALHEDAAREDGGRRGAGHRDPQHALETERTRMTRRYGNLRDPGPEALRSWRLEAPVSRRQQLRRHGHPE